MSDENQVEGAVSRRSARFRGPDKRPRQVPQREIPSYPEHPDGRGFAVIKWLGRRCYLGIWNSPESHRRYSQIVCEWNLGRDRVRTSPPKVSELLFHYQDFASQRYRKGDVETSEVRVLKTVIEDIGIHYGDLLTDEFTSLHLLQLRNAWKERYVRDTVNGHLSRVRNIFKFGVSRMLVKVETLTALQTVESLRKHEGRQNPKVMPVCEPDIDVVLNRVTAPVAAMIQVQRLSGMRPEEVVCMHVADIREVNVAGAASGEGDAPGRVVWVYSPRSHKTEHLDHTRKVVLGPRAIGVLRPLIEAIDRLTSGEGDIVDVVGFDDPRGYLFRPLSRWGSVAKNMRSHYSPDSYAKAIKTACLEAGIKVWAPNRLRHNAATELRGKFDVETARTVLGHSSMVTTEIYAERDLGIAIKAMFEVG